MIDLNPLTAISREIREWLQRSENRQIAEDQEMRNAVKSLSFAVVETRSYLRGINQENVERDLNKEHQLSILWNEAHMDFRRVDPNLADRCFAKAEYWADPTHWERTKLNQYNITLDSMSDAVRNFLIKSPEQ